MSKTNPLVKIIVFIVITGTVGFWLTTTKADFLGPMVSSCPAAISNLSNILQSIQGSPDNLMQNIWDCGAGFLLYIAFPGLGIGWIISKNI